MTPRPPAAHTRIGKGLVPGEPQEPVYGHVCRCGYPAAHWHHICSRSLLSGPYSVVEIDGMNWGNLVPLCFTCHEAVEHVGNRSEWADIELPEKDSELPYLFIWRQHGDWEPLRLSPLDTAPPSPAPGARAGLGSSPVGRSIEPENAGLTERGEEPGSNAGRGVNLRADHPRSVSSASSPGPEAVGEAAGDAPPFSPGASPGPGDNTSTGLKEGVGGSMTPVAPGQPPVLGHSLSLNPGETCPVCKRRVNHKKTDKSPVSKTISARLPADEQEGMKQLLADTAETIGASGLKYPTARVIEVGMLLIHAHHDEAIEVVKEMGEAA